MVARKRDHRCEEISAMWGGKGAIQIEHLYEDAQFDGHGRMYSHIRMEPGSSIGWHTHVGESESYYILRGTALLNNNGAELTVHAGDVALCANGEGHALENTGSETLEFMALILHGAQK